jgi:hypothetical protein
MSLPTPNGCHSLVAQFRQSLFGRLAGYADVNGADRLTYEPAMRLVGGRAVMGQASTSQMGRFETETMTEVKNIAALADSSARWIDRVHARRPVKTIVVDMDISVSPTFLEMIDDLRPHPSASMLNATAKRPGRLWRDPRPHRAFVCGKADRSALRRPNLAGGRVASLDGTDSRGNST